MFSLSEILGQLKLIKMIKFSVINVLYLLSGYLEDAPGSLDESLNITRIMYGGGRMGKHTNKGGYIHFWFKYILTKMKKLLILLGKLK